MASSDPESALRHALEIGLWRELPATSLRSEVVHKLATAIARSISVSKGSAVEIPTAIVLALDPGDVGDWSTEKLAEVLREAAQGAAARADVALVRPVTVRIQIETILSAEPVGFESPLEPPMAETQEAATSASSEIDGTAAPENAFLIVDGVKVHALRGAVTNIGRRLDNQLVVDDPRVSRHHAQLRVINGRFVIFDLNSSGGTYVNGHRTSQSILYAGDVISLAGMAMVFGQDSPVRRGSTGSTSPSQVSGIDRPTAILKDRSILDRFRKK